jgi:hypothetical protein
MKTQLLISSMILAVALTISLNSNADSGSMKKGMINEITVSTVLTSNNIDEENLQLETWMTDKKFWKLPAELMMTNEPVDKEKLRIEGWMTDDTLFRISSKKEIKNETERSLCIEKWMIDKAYWRM